MVNDSRFCSLFNFPSRRRSFILLHVLPTSHHRVMLWSPDSKKYIRDIPHQSFYDTCKKRLTTHEYQAAYDALSARVASDQILTSSWIPGHDWTGTPYQPIYEIACQKNEDAAARFFGLVLWHVLLDRSDAWAFGRYEKNNMPIAGMTYFRLDSTPRESSK